MRVCPANSEIRGINSSLQRRYSEGRYVLEAGNQVTFQVGAYDRTKPLIIDPGADVFQLSWRQQQRSGGRHRRGRSGNVYVTGFTHSSTSRGEPDLRACQGSCGSGSNYDAFVTKINASGNALVYSSYLGGSGGTVGTALPWTARAMPI